MGDSGAIYGFPGPAQPLAFGLGQEMQNYEQPEPVGPRAKCLSDSGRSKWKRNRTTILMHELFCSATV